MVDLSRAIVLLTHGAGAGMDSEFMLSITKLLHEQGVEVKCFEFPYMKKIRELGKRRPPDRMPKLLAAFEEAIHSLETSKKIFIAGKSMGGRVASLLAADKNLPLPIKGVICLGFPFHPPKKIDKYRGDHLAEITCSTLIIQGDRDTFGTQSEVSKYALSKNVRIEFLDDGDHSFKPRVRSGVTLEQNLKKCSDLMVEFIKNS